MAFKHHLLGSLVANEPATAHAHLSELFKKHGFSVKKVAEELGVGRGSIERWILSLRASGYQDPRGNLRGIPGRKPSAVSTDSRESVPPS